MNDYDHIVATKDWHPADHVSFVDSHRGKKVGDIIKVNGIDQIYGQDIVSKIHLELIFQKILTMKK